MNKIQQILPTEISDQELMIGVREGDSTAISKLYKFHFPTIRHMIISNSGSDDEAKDIFQDAVMVLYDKLIQGKFELNSKLSTFLYAVSRRLWLKQLSSKGTSVNSADISDFEDILKVEDDIERHEVMESNFEQMSIALEQLGEPCKTLLNNFYIASMSMEEIRNKFGYTSTDNAKTQKYKCLQRLKRLFFSAGGQ
ncbi:MAG TPA: sigma-70 family RNA polymerase sigma factor [Sphingobacterium sp.]|nr:sigma-70 family RNA polymerase sigma factor [Sphingobacterium sp.]